MNNNKKQSEREILEEILQTLTEQKKTLEMIVPNPLRIYNNKEIMELLGVKDKYLKKLRDNGYLGFSREGDKYWYTQKDVAYIIHRVFLVS
jgi:arginyl-tRNA synthetase